MLFPSGQILEEPRKGGPGETTPTGKGDDRHPMLAR
jgi:hypothetical protein